MLARNVAGVLIAAVSMLSVCERLAAQTSQQAFEHSELIIGYKSKGDREQAVKELNAAKKYFKVRGQTVENLQFQAIGNSALKLRIDLPTQVRGQTANDPALELQVLQETARQIREADKRVQYAHPNWILGINQLPPRVPIDVRDLDTRVSIQTAPIAGLPNDFAFVRGLHWHYAAPPMGMNAIAAWKSETGSRDVVVAVLDTGILTDHPDVQGSGNILPGYNFVTNTGRSADPTDPGDACPVAGRNEPSWHGTHVAGTIGAVGSNNGRGITGINWNVSVLPVRVVGRCGGSFTDITAGLLWAAGLPVDGVPLNPNPAHIINISLDGVLSCNEEQAGLLVNALKEVRAAGSIVVVAAGNDQRDVNGVAPGGCPGVISVTAGDKGGHLAWYSNFGNVTIMAPGGDLKIDNDSGYPAGVWSTVMVSSINREGVEPQQGTSMAAPHVSGAIALALAKHRDWRGKPDLIEQKLKSSVAPLINGACARPCGSGQLDAARLIDTQ